MSQRLDDALPAVRRRYIHCVKSAKLGSVRRLAAALEKREYKPVFMGPVIRGYSKPVQNGARLKEYVKA